MERIVELRSEIDDIDGQIKELLLKRLDIAIEVGHIKKCKAYGL